MHAPLSDDETINAPNPTPESERADSSGELLVSVENVSKKYCRSLKKSLWYGVQDIAHELNPFSRRDPSPTYQRANADCQLPHQLLAGNSSPSLREDEFWAVRDINFELRRGECLGLIGHNGAGKTTLLKMLNGLIKPDTGSITMRGRVGALIALGAGFNPILTGRENIYINGAVLGLTKQEIDEQIDEIIDFAELREFIDMPVQSYSSGMQVRLGFSVASSLTPDVLILDEVLAVGDIGFVIKCLNRVRQLTANAAVIFVSHQMQFVSSFCSRVLFMDHGHTELDADDPKDAIDRYFALVSANRNVAGLGTVAINRVSIRGYSPVSIGCSDTLPHGGSACVELEFNVQEESEPVLVSVSVDDIGGAQIITCPLVDEVGKRLNFTKGRYRVTVNLGMIELNSGKYSILVTVKGAVTQRILARSQGNAPFRVVSEIFAWSKLVRQVTPDVVEL